MNFQLLGVLGFWGNLKYEAVVYFAPEGWNDNKNCKKIDF